jgi:hypothetical protein
MPYIKKDKRESITLGGMSVIDYNHINTPGELNYAISTLVSEYWSSNRMDYQGINDILGALEGAKLEFYRRVVAPFEDKKIKENGDVY